MTIQAALTHIMAHNQPGKVPSMEEHQHRSTSVPLRGRSRSVDDGKRRGEIHVLQSSGRVVRRRGRSRERSQQSLRQSLRLPRVRSMTRPDSLSPDRTPVERRPLVGPALLSSTRRTRWDHPARDPPTRHNNNNNERSHRRSSRSRSRSRDRRRSPRRTRTDSRSRSPKDRSRIRDRWGPRKGSRSITVSPHRYPTSASFIHTSPPYPPWLLDDDGNLIAGTHP